MITIKNAQIYSMKGEMAYEVEYSDGTKVRVVESAGNIIRNEYLKDGKWIQAGKAYVVQHNKKRQAERLKEEVKKFLGK